MTSAAEAVLAERDPSDGVALVVGMATWLFVCYFTVRKVGTGFNWTLLQVLQVHRSVQCAILASAGIFSMGALHGMGRSLSGECSDDAIVGAIIKFFWLYFVSDLILMLHMGHFRQDLLFHHGVALTGISSLILGQMYPCSSSPVAATELISVFSGVEAMLPKPEARSRGEESVFYVIRSYRLIVLTVIRPFLWLHVRNSAKMATTTIQMATYLIPGSLLPLLDLVWSWKIFKSLFPGVASRIPGGGSSATRKQKI